MKAATGPRISINKLMEFMSALPSRQREIVDNQKNPLANKPKMAWCTSAKRAIIAFLADGCVNESILDDEIERLQEEIEHLDIKDPKKLESKERQLQVEIDAINSFKGLHQEIGLKGVLFSKVSKRPKYLNFAGVHVSVYPEILILKKESWEHIGCLKLYFTKNIRLHEEEADFLCSILNHYADTHLSPNHSANPKACIAIDVFGHRVFRASENVAFHKGEIQKCCQDIREMWADVPKRKEIKAGDNGQNELDLFE